MSDNPGSQWRWANGECPSRHSPASLRGAPFAARLAVLACAVLLSGCALNGDFGRARDDLVSDHMHDWVGRDAVGSIGEKPSKFPLTDDERRLRDLGFALIQPAYDRNRWYSVLQDYGFDQGKYAPPFDPAAYWVRLDAAYRRSEASSYAQIAADARNDVVRLDPFFGIAARVTDMDAKRAQSLTYVAGSTGLSAAEVANARRRNDENVAVVAWVCHSLRERAVSYRFALDRLVVRMPSPDAADAERSINLLQTRAGQSCAPVAVPLQHVVRKG
jgi:hypothetical protein